MVRDIINAIQNRDIWIMGIFLIIFFLVGIFHKRISEGFGLTEPFLATPVGCKPCRTTFTGYQNVISKPGPEVPAGYPFGFISQLNDAKLETPYADIPNVWPKDRSCDIEWNRSQSENPCKRQDLKTYFGSGIPIKTDEVCTRESDGESMFYFKNYRSSPECCPGPYSTDGGCVCAFEKPVCHKWPQDLSKNPLRITFH